MQTKGVHYIAEFWDIKSELLDNQKDIENQMVAAAKVANGNILNVFTHKFSPQGVSTVITISESHLSIHTFPEIGYCSIDIYTCGKTYADKAIMHLHDHFKPKRKQVIEIVRGIDNPKVNTGWLC